MNDLTSSSSGDDHDVGLATAERIAGEMRGFDDHTDPFVAAVRATRMPIVISDPRSPDNPIVFANDAFCRLCGYDRGEIVGRNCRFLQGSDTDAGTVASIREAVTRAKPIETDILNYRKTGEAFWNRLLMAPVFDRAGAVAYFFASQVDVTPEHERLKGLETANASLLAELTDQLRLQQEREREMAFAMRAGRFGTWSLDLPSRELTSSETCKALFGRDPLQPFSYDERLGAIFPADRPGVEAAMARTISKGADYDVTYRIRARSPGRTCACVPTARCVGWRHAGRASWTRSDAR